MLGESLGGWPWLEFGSDALLFLVLVSFGYGIGLDWNGVGVYTIGRKWK